VAVKLYPLVLVPLFAVILTSRSRWRAAAWLVGGTGLAVLAIAAPLVLLAPEQAVSFLRYHQARGLQMESAAGALLALGGSLGVSAPVVLTFNYGAWHLNPPAGATVLRALPFVFLIVLGGTLYVVARRHRLEAANGVPMSPARVAADAAAVLLVFMTLNKVFSPQYVVWLLPFLPLLPRPHVVAGLVLFALTFDIYPFEYPALLQLDVWAYVLVNAAMPSPLG
jgi:uncharacterized membrane protein